MRSPYLLPPALAVGIVASPAYEALQDITPSLVRAVLQHAVRGEEAPDPLTNGDFETGSLPPWNFTQLGKPLGVAASLVPTERRGPENATAAGGHWHLCLSTNWHRPLLGTTRATLEQPLFVQDGVQYNLSWRMMGRGGDKVAVSNSQSTSRVALYLRERLWGFCHGDLHLKPPLTQVTVCFLSGLLACEVLKLCWRQARRVVTDSGTTTPPYLLARLRTSSSSRQLPRKNTALPNGTLMISRFNPSNFYFIRVPEKMGWYIRRCSYETFEHKTNSN